MTRKPPRCGTSRRRPCGTALPGLRDLRSLLQPGGPGTSRIARTIALVAEARINIVSLPTVNLYLQDRMPDRTPRWRGVTLIKELRRAGVRVAIAGDNCRDPFHAYGDHDMVDTFRQAVRILHLDHPHGDAPALVSRVPAGIMDIRPQRYPGASAPRRHLICSTRARWERVGGAAAVRPHRDPERAPPILHAAGLRGTGVRRGREAASAPCAAAACRRGRGRVNV